MHFSFDLISDLHIESWPNFDWTGQATSPYCIVAGDVARDHRVVAQTLEHLGQCYQGVFYIDGNEEHRNNIENLGDSYRMLDHNLDRIKNAIYLQDNVIIINGVAILATNGWWGFDFDHTMDYNYCQDWYCERMNISRASADSITGIAFNDALYLSNSVKKLQTHQDVKTIVIVSHTVPIPALVDHDIDLFDTPRFNCIGNRHLQMALEEDTEDKIKTWCFGHYHKSVDQTINGIRYVNNCRGRANTPWNQSVFYPKKITIDF